MHATDSKSVGVKGVMRVSDKNAKYSTARLLNKDCFLESTEMNVTKLKVFGERNTGTNFVEAILRRNVDCEIVSGNLSRVYAWRFTLAYKLLPYDRAFQYVERRRDKIFAKRFAVDGGWKHAKTPNFPPGITSYPKGIGLIAITKNPYAWLLSLHRRPYQGTVHTRFNPLPFSEFLRTPWETVGRECADTYYETPIHLWNDKVASYYDLPQHAPTLIERYEQIIADIPNFLSDVSANFGIVSAVKPDIPVSSSKKDGRTTQDIIAYYEENRWRSSISDEDMGFINDHLDRPTMEKIGYQVLS